MKSLLVSMCVLFASASSVLADAQQFVCDPSSNGTNIYSEPSTENSRIYRTVKNGEKITVNTTEKNSTGELWYEIIWGADDGDVMGYVISSAVKPVCDGFGVLTDTNKKPDSLPDTTSDQQYMTVCNSKIDITNVRSGPSSKNYPKVAEVINGQVVEILEKVTNGDGYDYYKIIYYSEMGGGQLIENEGYVYHEALASTCTADVSEVAESLAKWPQVIDRWGCAVSFPDRRRMDAWSNAESSTIGKSGSLINFGYGLCKSSEEKPVEIKEYLGSNADQSEYRFLVAIDRCDMTFTAKFNFSARTISYSTSYGSDCHLFKSTPKSVNKKPGFFAQWAENMFAGQSGETSGGGVSANWVPCNTIEDQCFKILGRENNVITISCVKGPKSLYPDLSYSIIGNSSGYWGNDGFNFHSDSFEREAYLMCSS